MNVSILTDDDLADVITSLDATQEQRDASVREYVQRCTAIIGASRPMEHVLSAAARREPITGEADRSLLRSLQQLPLPLVRFDGHYACATTIGHSVAEELEGIDAGNKTPVGGREVDGRSGGIMSVTNHTRRPALGDTFECDGTWSHRRNGDAFVVVLDVGDRQEWVGLTSSHGCLETDDDGVVCDVEIIAEVMRAAGWTVVPPTEAS